jgi:hypothetical protein
MSRIKFKSQCPKKNEVYTFGASGFAPDYSATVLAAKMCINSYEHFICISLRNAYNRLAFVNFRQRSLFKVEGSLWWISLY